MKSLPNKWRLLRAGAKGVNANGYLYQFICF